MTAEEMIKNYDTYKDELSVLEFRIKTFKGISENDIIESMMFEYHENEGGHTNTITDKTAKIALNFRKEMEKANSDMLKYYLERYHKLRAVIDFFEFAVNKLDNKEIAKKLFLAKKQWVDIERQYSISHVMLGKHRKKAIKGLKEIYRMREKYEIDYTEINF